MGLKKFIGGGSSNKPVPPPVNWISTETIMKPVPPPIDF